MMCATVRDPLYGHAIKFTRDEAVAIGAAVARIGEVDESAVNLCGERASELRSAGTLIHERCPSMREFIAALNDPRLGYSAIDLKSLGSSEVSFNRRCLLAIVSAFALPMGVFIRSGLWKLVEVNSRAGLGKLGSVEQIPFHIDFVNASEPPEYVLFHCLRSDPSGGGASLVSNLTEAVNKLSAAHLDILQDDRLTEGAFYDLANIGCEYNPFRVLEPMKGNSQLGHWSWIRFTAKVLRDLPKGPFLEAMYSLNNLLWQQRVRFPLREGQVLIVRQRFACHGREALAFPRILGEGARLVEQGFAMDWRRSTSIAQ